MHVDPTCTQIQVNRVDLPLGSMLCHMHHLPAGGPSAGGPPVLPLWTLHSPLRTRCSVLSTLRFTCMAAQFSARSKMSFDAVPLLL